ERGQGAGSPQLPAGRHEEDGGSQPEAQQREPARRQPAQRQLGKRHGRAPQQPGGSEGGDGAATVDAHVTMVRDRTFIICQSCAIAKYNFVIWLLNLTMLM